MSEGWRSLIVKEFSRLTAGGTPSTSKMEYWSNGTIPWLSSGEVHKKRIRYVDGYITEDGLKNSAAKLIPIKTLLVALAGQGKTRGTVAITEIETTTNQSIAGIIVDKEICHPDYLFFNLDSRYDELRSISGGSGRAGLNLEILGNIDVSLPPLPEQKKIASILTSVDEVIENTQKQIDKLQDLKKATMNELLTKGIGHTEFKDSEFGRIPEGWSQIKIGDIGSFFGGLTGKTAKDFGEGHPFLTYMQVYLQQTSDMEATNSVRIDEDEKQNAVAYGDILFTTSSETPDEIGMTDVFLNSNHTPYLNSFCFGLRPITPSPIDPTFGKYVFRGDDFREDMRPLAQGSTRFNLSKGNLAKLSLLVPSLPEQKKIASILSSMDKNIEEKQRKLHQTQSLKKSLMQDLLTGKVRVTVN